MAADESSNSATVLDLMAEPRRIDIIQALVEHRRERPDDSISFSRLFERSTHHDKGNFNYHLDRLRGSFVEKDDDGYRLTSAGELVAGAILAGTFDGSARELPVDGTCPMCDGTLSVNVEAGWTDVRCENDHVLLGACLPPGIADGRPAADVFGLAVRYWQHVIEFSRVGACIKCFGRERGRFRPLDPNDRAESVRDGDGERAEAGEEDVTGDRDVKVRDGNGERAEAGEEDGTDDRIGTDTGDAYVYETHCERCGHYYRTHPLMLVVRDPAVVALCHDNDVDPYETPPWDLPYVDADAVTVYPEAPFRIELSVCVGNDEVRFTFDEDGSVLDVVENRSHGQDRRSRLETH